VALREGDVFEYVFDVGPQHSAKHVGSGDVEVLSTPSLILFMEEACLKYSQEGLEEGKTTVGTRLDVYHVKAAPVNTKVKVRGRLLSVDGRRLLFWVEAFWKDVRIGYGLHERFIVDKEKFISKVREAIKG